MLGDHLLTKAQDVCRCLGANVMLLVHDDQGSGKLISYYKTRGFEPIFDYLDRAMVGTL